MALLLNKPAYDIFYYNGSAWASVKTNKIMLFNGTTWINANSDKISYFDQNDSYYTLAMAEFIIDKSGYPFIAEKIILNNSSAKASFPYTINPNGAISVVSKPTYLNLSVDDISITISSSSWMSGRLGIITLKCSNGAKNVEI